MSLAEKDDRLIDLTANMRPASGPAIVVDLPGRELDVGVRVLVDAGDAGWLHTVLTSEASKRVLDVVGASVLLLFFLPVFLLIGIALAVTEGTPVLFSQMRVGRGGKMFRCYKFRTMARNAEHLLRCHLEASEAARSEWAAFHKLHRDPRVTRLGAMLRKSSLDELPQLWNVLRGEMSLVGPRPIVTDEISRYDGDFTFYAQVRPGLTGLWQISGRSDTTYEERVRLDVKYVREHNLVLDIFILLKTAGVAWTGRGSC
ncbi:sugar transferase [Tianweitania sp.]|uniref:sugar transferase n=1 Tax=Tianweitania sp. TaxID=2021634 RepID=UPI00289C09EF|nr:sugar transferase [Tianweitania sp.]